LLRFLARATVGRPRITVLSRDPDRFARQYPDLAQHVRFVQGDVRTFAFPAETYTHIVHGAADTSVAAATRPEELVDTIVAGTGRVLRFAASCKARKLLFLSSGAVYGAQPPDLTCMPETYPGVPDPSDGNAAYGRAKRAAEDLCMSAAASRLEVKIARLFTFVGEDLPIDAHFAVGNFIRDAIEGKPVHVKGDGTPVRSYLYQEDLAAWLVALLEKDVPGQVCNVGSGRAISMLELAKLVARIIGAPGVAVESARPDYAGRLRYIPCVVRARELGLSERIVLEDAVARVGAFHRALRTRRR
jgi:dTDP-glucose 4,6-dehydratase